MGTSHSAAQFAGKIKSVGPALEKERKRSLDALGQQMVTTFDKAVSADLNVTGTPQGYRNWVQHLSARAKVTQDQIRFAPFGRSVGPIRMAEEGRQGGAASDLILVGKVRKKSGTKRAKSRGRNQGATGAKGTWSDATEAIAAELPTKLQAGFIKAAREVF